MKKSVITLLSLAGVGLVLSGCSNNSTSTTKSTKSSKSIKTVKKAKPTSNVVKINKTSNEVNPIKVHVESVRYEKVKNKESNYTDAEYNMEGDPKTTLNKEYYRATVSLYFENTGDKPVDLSFGDRSYTVDDGTVFPSFGGANGNAMESSISKIPPHGKLAETVILVSNNKFTANHLQVTFNGIYANEDTQLSDGGTAKIN